MLPGKNKIKYLSSLKIKKFRDTNRQFIVEGDKIVKEVLRYHAHRIVQLYATTDWLNLNRSLLSPDQEVFETSLNDLSRISTFETPPQTMALLNMEEKVPDPETVFDSLCIALDNVQDPGNIGTIIRTADWFGIGHVFCSEGCADPYNPKVIQSSMGSVLNVNVYFTDLTALLQKAAIPDDYYVGGTFMDGTSVYEMPAIRKGLIMFGNESRGISGTYLPLLKNHITIPAASKNTEHVESLNVASAVAIVLSHVKSKR